MACKMPSHLGCGNPLTFTILVYSETDLDEVMQIQNVFMNVSKGQVANSDDLTKAFGKAELNDIIKEVGILIISLFPDAYRNRLYSRS